MLKIDKNITVKIINEDIKIKSIKLERLAFNQTHPNLKIIQSDKVTKAKMHN